MIYKTTSADRPYVIDLFAEIEKCYGGTSIFDSITEDDLIMAFFPCIYFTGFTIHATTLWRTSITDV